MKKSFSLLILLFLANIGYSQEIKISYKALPNVVLTTFRNTYPNARIKSATKEINKGETDYEITCNDDGASRTITLDKDGKIIETEEDITIDKLPDPVTKALTKKYATGKVLHIESSVKDLKTTYEVLIRDKKKKFEVVFTPEGSIVRTK